MSEFSDKIKTIGVIGRRTRDTVTSGRTESGEPFKKTTDELGNTITEYAERQDVTIRPDAINLRLGAI